MERKIIEYGIKQLHKYKVEQTDYDWQTVYDCYSLLLITSYKKIWSEHLHFPNRFLYFFDSYDITSLENIYSIKFWKYTKHSIRCLV